MLICDWCTDGAQGAYISIELSVANDEGITGVEWEKSADLCDDCRRRFLRRLKALWKELAPKVKAKR